MDFNNKPLFLGPMAGNGDYAFRRICKEMGAEYTVTEMVSAKAVWYHDQKTAQIAHIHEDERPCLLQLFGSEEKCFDYAVKTLEESVHPEGFDINMGCPAPKIFNNHEGSALLKDLHKVESVVKAVRNATRLPVSVKMRLGVEQDHFVAVEAAKCCEAAGADFIALHGRYRDQHYSGKADWEKIALVKQAISVPLIANGDVTGYESYLKILRETGADAVMIGRGAIGDPFIFERIRAGVDGIEYSEPTLDERVAVAMRQLSLSAAEKGEYTAVREARGQLAHYFKGFSGAAQLRSEINRAESKAQIEAAVAAFAKQIDKKRF